MDILIILGNSKIKNTITKSSYCYRQQRNPFCLRRKPYPGREKIEPITLKKQDFIELGTPESNALLGKAGLTAIHSPGHSPGHTCYYHSEDNLLIEEIF